MMAAVSIVHRDDEDYETVAVGAEESREYGGAEALARVIADARKRGWRTARNELRRRRKRNLLDGTLEFGCVATLGGKLNDDRALDELFEACARNWREYPNRPEKAASDARATWLQATRGDCDEPAPLDPRVANKLWLPWFRLMGLGKREAKRKFLFILQKVDPGTLLTPRLPEVPPPGFPTTAVGGEPICARCNTVRGCDAPLLVEDEYLFKRLADLRVLLSSEDLKTTLDRACRRHRCVHGVHARVPATTAREFASWFAQPGLGGFQDHREVDSRTGRPTSFEDVLTAFHEAVLREHRAYEWLEKRCSSSNTATSDDDEGDEVAETTYFAARDRLAALCFGLRQVYNEWTGRPFKVYEPCTREVASCVHRRKVAVPKSSPH